MEEARAILGVGPDADEAEIRKAHRAMMKKVHPDQGGTDALAAKVQQARDVLLGD
jgi:curved DNA-binding protein CbpA